MIGFRVNAASHPALMSGNLLSPSRPYSFLSLSLSLTHTHTHTHTQTHTAEGSSTPALNTQVRSICAEYTPEVELGTTSACCSDQQSFYENGFAAAGMGFFFLPLPHRHTWLPLLLWREGIFEHDLAQGAGAYPCYHQTCDTPDQIDYDMLAENTKVSLSLSLSLSLFLFLSPWLLTTTCVWTQ